MRRCKTPLFHKRRSSGFPEERKKRVACAGAGKAGLSAKTPGKAKRLKKQNVRKSKKYSEKAKNARKNNRRPEKQRTPQPPGQAAGKVCGGFFEKERTAGAFAFSGGRFSRTFSAEARKNAGACEVLRKIRKFFRGHFLRFFTGFSGGVLSAFADFPATAQKVPGRVKFQAKAKKNKKRGAGKVSRKMRAFCGARRAETSRTFGVAGFAVCVVRCAQTTAKMYRSTATNCKTVPISTKMWKIVCE